MRPTHARVTNGTIGPVCLENWNGETYLVWILEYIITSYNYFPRTPRSVMPWNTRLCDICLIIRYSAYLPLTRNKYRLHIDICIFSISDMHTLQWRHNGCDSVSNHQPRDCLLYRLFRRRSKKTSKLRVTGLCASATGEFPVQMASNAENVSIWWRHHAGAGNPILTAISQTSLCCRMREANPASLSLWHHSQ